jgi:hypothetical protein
MNYALDCFPWKERGSAGVAMGGDELQVMVLGLDLLHNNSIGSISRCVRIIEEG